jgi:16S rRNA (guanine1516-N2)-methyltransferase
MVGSFTLDLISVWAEDVKLQAEAENLAKSLKLEFTSSKPSTKLVLYFSAKGLGITFTNEKPFRPFQVDFQNPEWQFRKRRGLADNKMFFSALALAPGKKILDTTAGFGQDAFLMAWAGAKVTAIERSQIVFELLRDGLVRAQGWEETPERISLVRGEAITFLGPSFDCIYIDPMFDKPKKTAKSPKSMQLLQGLLEESDPLPLIAAARQVCKRVVVKLPLKGDAIAGEPNITYKGQSIRFDVYTSV